MAKGGKGKAEKLAAAGEALRAAALGRAVDLDNVPQKAIEAMGMTRRGFFAFVRANAEALGGEYRPSRRVRGDARAFDRDDRQGRDTPITFRFRD